MIVIGADHAGVEAKAYIKEYFAKKGETVLDEGTFTEDSVDYPDFAHAVCEKVQFGQAEWGILICGTGIGMSMAANKHRGIRAALAVTPFMATMAKQHNNANILCLGARVLSPEEMIPIIEAYQGAVFEGGKHQRRVDGVMAIEGKDAEKRAGKIVALHHPLIQHKLSMLRDKMTSVKEFRELTEEISLLMGYEVTRDWKLTEVEIETPICLAKTKVIAGSKQCLVPILRAGLGMVEGLIKLMPAARVGHIGVYRDPETLTPVEYYGKLPTDVSECSLLVLDPMLATGGSAVAVIDFIKRKGGKDISLVNILATPEGIRAVQKAHPDVNIYVAAVD